MKKWILYFFSSCWFIYYGFNRIHLRIRKIYLHIDNFTRILQNGNPHLLDFTKSLVQIFDITSGEVPTLLFYRDTVFVKTTGGGKVKEGPLGSSFPRKGRGNVTTPQYINQDRLPFTPLHDMSRGSEPGGVY